jgi:alpha-N-arabinofuranosidase
VRVEADAPAPLGLSVSASKSDKELVITFVNPHHDTDLHVDCAIKGSNVTGGSAQILHDADWNACNSFDNPDRVVPKQHPIRVKDAGMEVELPRLSVVTAVVTIR